jgi:rare lipoprotein A
MKYFSKNFIILLFSLAIPGCASVQPESMPKWVGYTETGKASYYGDQYQFKKTASGEPYNHDLKTAAHRNIPLGSKLKVTNVDNGKSVVVKVNDRGPFVQNRIVDLSKSAFSTIGNTSSGLINVEIGVIE